MKKPLHLFALSLISIAFSTHAHADPYDDCTAEYDYMNNAVVAECSEYASDIYKEQITKHYNKIYKALKAQSPEHAKDFERSQQAWITYRDLDCSLRGAYVGSPMYVHCPMMMNGERAEALKELAESF